MLPQFVSAIIALVPVTISWLGLVEVSWQSFWHGLVVRVDQEPYLFPEIDEAVDLDVGVTPFVVDSAGIEIENPRCVELSEDKSAKRERKLARSKKGSNSYKSIKDKTAKLHKRINCRRDDFLHNLSRIYVKNRDASFGCDMGRRALQRAVVHSCLLLLFYLRLFSVSTSPARSRNQICSLWSPRGNLIR